MSKRKLRRTKRKYHFKVTSVRELTTWQYYQAKWATLGDEGLMRDYIIWLRHNPNIRNFVIWVTDSKHNLAAWSLVHLARNRHCFDSHFYVKVDHRGQGLGAKMYRMARRLTRIRYGKPTFYAYRHGEGNDPSRKFFAALKHRNPLRK